MEELGQRKLEFLKADLQDRKEERELQSKKFELQSKKFELQQKNLDTQIQLQIRIGICLIIFILH